MARPCFASRQNFNLCILVRWTVGRVLKGTGTTSIAGIRRRYVTCNLIELSDDEKEMIEVITPPVSPWGMSHSEVFIAGDSISSSAKRVSLVLAAFDYTKYLLQDGKSKLKRLGLIGNILASLKGVLASTAETIFP